jgi:hypothetical protein
VRKRERPTVSKTRARAPTAKVSRGRFSVAIWETNCEEKIVSGLVFYKPTDVRF